MGIMSAEILNGNEMARAIQVMKPNNQLFEVRLIYNSKKMSAKKPQTFSEWYQYFCKIVGCEYNKEYKPSKLKDSEGLEKEFAFLL
jgi:hypothetical protein